MGLTPMSMEVNNRVTAMPMVASTRATIPALPRAADAVCRGKIEVATVLFGLAALEGRLLRAETLRMLRTPLELGSGESTGYGLGWFVREISIGPGSEPTTVFGHEGSSVGGTTSFVTIPEQGIVVAITTNVSFARSLATERELGAGVRPFFRASSLSRVLANTFARTNATTRR